MSMMRAARRGLIVVGTICAIALVAAVPHVKQLLAIGAAYKAKMVCSGIFVSRRGPDAVLGDLQVDDLAVLRHVSVSVDGETRSVTASAFGLVTRRAVYHDGLGCALVLDSLTPPGLAASMPAVLESNAVVQGGDVLAGPITPVGMGSMELSSAIDRAFSEPEPTYPRRTQAVVVVHRGRLVAERYAAGLGPGTPLIGWSMTKSVMNALVGILVKEGRLSLWSPVAVQTWQGLDDGRATITLDNLLRMSSGLRFDEDMSSAHADVIHMLLAVGDTAAYAAGKDLTNSPGTVWQYSSGASNIISGVIRHVLQKDADYLTYPRRALFDRIGMSSAILETDAAGTFVGSSYMYASARDWARFGLLYLNDGIWSGDRVLPKGWVNYTTTPAPADPKKSYGAHFWLRIPEEYRKGDGRLPADAYHAVGHEGQFVTIIPSREAVIVRLGRTRYPNTWDQSAFVLEVLEALDHSGR